MNLGDILTTRQIVPELAATNRWEAIDELIGALVAAGKITPENREAVTAVVKKREQSMSTGIGFATFGDEKSMTTVRAVSGVALTKNRCSPRAADASTSANAPGLSRKFRNPGPAISTGSQRSATSSWATTSVASWRGFSLRALAAAMSALLW